MDTPFLEEYKQKQLASLKQQLAKLDAIKHQYKMKIITAGIGEKINLEEELDTDIEPKIQQLLQEIQQLERDKPQSETDPAYLAASAKLQQLLSDSGDLSQLTERECRIVATHKPANLTEHYYACIAKWCGQQRQLHTRFTPLTLLLDQGKEAQGERFQPAGGKTHEFTDLRDILAAQPDTLAFVLLGAPGSGKSTLLQRLEWDTAKTAIGANASETLIPFYVNLNRYKTDDQSPLSPWRWLHNQWPQGLGDFKALVKAGRVLLLIDALNEMPHTDEADYQRLLIQWRDFIRQVNDFSPGNRVIFSCRALNYSIGLSTPNELPVPHIRIESLNEQQIADFLQCYHPEHADILLQQLKQQKQLTFYSNPYFLSLLVKQVTDGGRIPKGRAALFTGFVRQALLREIDKDSPLANDFSLLTSFDRTELQNTQNQKNSYQLPDEGTLCPQLQTLAFKMQNKVSGQENVQVVISRNEAFDYLNLKDDRLLQAGVATGVLDEDELSAKRSVKYCHQLFQEYFAARHLAQHPQPETVASPWLQGDLKPTLEETLASIADYEPLPPPPSSPWLETTLIAAPMATSPEDFIRQIMAVNLPLAGRCAAQPEMDLPSDFVDQLRQQLLQRMQNTKADLRARIAAGKALGELGDPRLTRHQGPYGDYLLPKMMTIPGGTYSIGSDEGLYEDESPAHSITLNEFAMAQTPVTNAEWALFMAAGGYDNEEWWPTEVAKAWRRGENTDEGPKQQWRENREYIKKNPDLLKSMLSEGRMTSKQVDDWEAIVNMSDEEFDSLLRDRYPSNQQHSYPKQWLDSVFNNPIQPVVGISWLEALAYCTWLTAQTGEQYQLPSEAQWEAAARGVTTRSYAWAEKFEVQRCNTFESHIRSTTPVGLFVEGNTPDSDLADMSGNVWEWTSSLYHDYPYVADDEREDPNDSKGRRVVRGGSWNNDQHNARCAFRNNNFSDNRNNNIGFRLSCVSHIGFDLF